jgi:hypothetical protein
MVKPSTTELDAVKDSVHVFARFRPPNGMERAAAAEGRSTTCSSISADGKSVRLHCSTARSDADETTQVLIKTGGDDADGGELAFNFDQVMSECSQSDVYAAVGAPLIASTFAGFNTTLFAYGQTGSGKTHTMYVRPPLANRSKCQGAVTLHRCGQVRARYSIGRRLGRGPSGRYPNPTLRTRPPSHTHAHTQ